MGLGKMASVAIVAALGVAASAASAQTFSGNGKTGFGGPVGNSTLTVTDGGTTFNFSLATTGTGNSIAFYIDSIAGGVTDTSTLSDPDANDGGRQALSGSGDGGLTRSLVTFAPGFAADFGIAVQPGSFAGLFDITPPTPPSPSFQFVSSANLVGGASDTTVTFSINKADIGLPAVSGGSFQFVATLLNAFDSPTTVFRSNETIGASNEANNPGQTGTLTFTGSNVVGVVPEPATLGVLGAAALLLGRRRRA